MRLRVLQLWCDIDCQRPRNIVVQETAKGGDELYLTYKTSRIFSDNVKEFDNGVLKADSVHGFLQAVGSGTEPRWVKVGCHVDGVKAVSTQPSVTEVW